MTETEKSDWEQECSDLLDALTSNERRLVTTAVADNVLEGWRPTRADIEALIGVARGEVTTEEYLANLRSGSAAHN